MRRVVPVALLALAALQMGTLSAAVGSIVRAKAPAAAAHLPPPSGAPARRDLDAVLLPSEFVDAPFPGSAPNRTRVVYPEYPERSRGIVMIVPVAPEALSGRPSRRASAPDLHGLSDWVRSLAGALATEGFIAVAPDLLAGVTREGIGYASSASAWPRSHARTGWLRALRAQAPDLPAAGGPVGVVGFGWGGSAGFAYPVDQPELDALVVFHGDAPTPESDYGRINAPVLDLYSGGRQATATKPQSPAAAAGGAFEVLVRHGVTFFLKTSTACHATC
ncbi:MAG: dienelactone hydrolase family protein [Acidobacteria bacterium]|nr:dienelactone hydrolase family protein [Acidobacteriota bacterium]